MKIAQRYDALAATYDQTWRHYNRAVHDEVLRRLPHNLEGARVLDVGCGTGEWLQLLLRRRPQVARVVGVEPSREMLNQACARFAEFRTPTTIELLQNSIETVVLQSDAFHAHSFSDHSFRLVTSLNVLHYLEKPQQFFVDMYRVLEPGGILIVQDYAHNGWPFFEVAARVVDKGARHLYTPRELNDLAESAGFRVERVRTFRISGFWRGVILVARKTAC